MKTTLSILAGITLMIAAVTNRVSVSPQSNANLKRSQTSYDVNKGCYLASEFAQFKKENLREDLNVEVPVSDKVLFKAFVSYKKAQKLN
jgi:hypothetical protein